MDGYIKLSALIVEKLEGKMNLIQSINYVQENKLHAEANRLANKVNNIYIACLMIANNVPQTKENLEMCKKLVEQKKETDRKAFNDYLDGGYNNGINS